MSLLKLFSLLNAIKINWLWIGRHDMNTNKKHPASQPLSATSYGWLRVAFNLVKVQLIIAKHGTNQQNILSYYSTVASFYRIGARQRAKHASVLNCTIPVWPVFNFAEGGRSKNKMQWDNEHLIRCLVYNTRGRFTHCSQNTTQLVKYPRVLLTTTPNLVYLTHLTISNVKIDVYILLE